MASESTEAVHGPDEGTTKVLMGSHGGFGFT